MTQDLLNLGIVRDLQVAARGATEEAAMEESQVPPSGQGELTAFFTQVADFMRNRDEAEHP